MTYEYKVIPAPTRGQKAKGIKAPEGRFANALEIEMNRLSAEGWEYLRADTLPHEERSGLTGSSTSYRSVLVFRRAKVGDVVAFQPETLAAPQVVEIPAPTVPIADPEEQNAPADTPNSEQSQAKEEGNKTDGPAEKDLKEAAPIADVNVALKKRVETLDPSK